MERNHAQNLLNLVKIISSDFPTLEVKSIIELGARDCEETISLNHFYPQAQLFTFECNPEKLEQCRSNIKELKHVKLIEKAVSNKKGTVDFFQIDKVNTVTTWEDGNPGASSLFEASGKYTVEQYAQKKIQVVCTTLYDEIQAKNVLNADLMWMDIQGSELNALKGMKEHLKDVSIIHTEVEFMEIYKGEPLFWEVKKFLQENGFYLGYFTSFYKNLSADAVFINQDLLSKNWFKKQKYALKHKLLQPLYHYGVYK